MNAIVNSARAELLRLRRWPAVWVVLGAGLLIACLFGYVFNYVAYQTGGSNFAGEELGRQELFASLLPEALPSVLVQGMPMFGGALMMVLGAISAGNGYAYGTGKTIYTQGPSRSAVTAGSLLALTTFVIGVLVATLVLFTTIAGLLGPVETFTQVLPGAAAGSLVGAIIGGDAAALDTPGVLDVLSGPTAAVSVALYLVVLARGTMLLVRRRDVV